MGSLSIFLFLFCFFCCGICGEIKIIESGWTNVTEILRNNAPGDTFLFSPGLYNITMTIDFVYPNVTLLKLNPEISSGEVVLFIMQTFYISGSNFSMANITLTGNQNPMITFKGEEGHFSFCNFNCSSSISPSLYCLAISETQPTDPVSLSISDSSFSPSPLGQHISVEVAKLSITNSYFYESKTAIYLFSGKLFASNISIIGSQIGISAKSDSIVNVSSSIISHCSNSGIDAFGSLLLLSSVTFSNNFAPSINGSSIAATQCTTKIESCHFTNNTGFYGGAIFLHVEYELMEIYNSSFYNNTGNTGGAVYVLSSINSLVNFIVENSEFSNNTAFSYGGALYLGGIQTEMKNSNIKNNNANMGGGLYSHNGLCIFENLILKWNSAENWGGAIAIIDQSLNMDKTTIVENKAKNGNGGGIYLRYPQFVYIFNSDFLNNTSGDFGGAIYFYQPQAQNHLMNLFCFGNRAARGGCLSVEGDNRDYIVMKIERSNIVSNSALVSGGGYFAVGSRTNITSSNFLFNSVDDGSGGGLYFEGPSSAAYVRYSNISNNKAGNGGGFYFEYVQIVLLYYCEIANNGIPSMTEYGGGVMIQGGYLEFRGCTISRNHAIHGGAFATLPGSKVLMLFGSMFQNDNVLHIETDDDTIIKNVTITQTQSTIFSVDYCCNSGTDKTQYPDGQICNYPTCVSSSCKGAKGCDCPVVLPKISEEEMIGYTHLNCSCSQGYIGSTCSSLAPCDSNEIRIDSYPCATYYHLNRDLALVGPGSVLFVMSSDVIPDFPIFVPPEVILISNGTIVNCNNYNGLILQGKSMLIGLTFQNCNFAVTVEPSTTGNVIKNCVFKNNNIAIDSMRTELVISNSTFESSVNTAIRTNGSTIAFDNLYFGHNGISNDNGGAIYSVASKLSGGPAVFEFNNGAIYGEDSEMTMTNIIFRNNSAISPGAHISLFLSVASFTHSSFIGGATTVVGGALYSVESSTSFSNCNFVDNNAINNGIAFIRSNTTKWIDCNITNNFNSVDSEDNSLLYVEQASVIITSSSFKGNMNGATLKFIASNIELKNINVSGSSSLCSGDIQLERGSKGNIQDSQLLSSEQIGLNIMGSNIEIDNCLVANHTNLPSHSNIYGAGIQMTNSSVTIRNSRIENNKEIKSGGLYAEFSSVVVINSSFQYNRASQIGGIFTTYSDFSAKTLLINGNKNGGLHFEHSRSVIVIDGLTCTNNEIKSEMGACGMFYNSSHSLSNSRIAHNGGIGSTGIDIYSCKNSAIANCKFYNNSVAVKAIFSDNLQIDNCELISDSSPAVIFLLEVKKTILLNSTVSGGFRPFMIDKIDSLIVRESIFNYTQSLEINLCCNGVNTSIPYGTCSYPACNSDTCKNTGNCNCPFVYSPSPQIGFDYPLLLPDSRIACSCEFGFIGDTCNAFDPACQMCGYNSTCQRDTKSNSTYCRCNNGFTETHEIGVCIDIDECENTTICAPPNNCFNTIGNYTCSLCPTGFHFINSSCQDINECKTENGGCDFRVNCTNTIGSRDCGDCPLGTIGSGYSFCQTLCGDTTCNSTIGENCLTCPKDCPNNCGLCGDGVCDVGETCSTCFADCKSNCTKQCTSCSIHGSCVEGVCECSGVWSGPACDIMKEPVVVVINTTQPGAVVVIDPNTQSTTSSSKPNLQVSFSITIRRLVEKSKEGAELSVIDLRDSNINFTFGQSTFNNSKNILYEYSTVLPNRAYLSIVFLDFKDESTNYNFFTENFTFPANTLKVNFKVANWPFMSLYNTLDVEMDNLLTTQGDTGCSTQESEFESDGGGNLQWVKLSFGEFVAYAQFVSYAVVDNRTRVVSFALVPGSSVVSASLPHFWDAAEFDPHYSVLIDTQRDDSCDLEQPKNNKKGVSNTVAIAVSVSIVGAIVLGGGGYFAFRKYTQRKRFADLRERMSGISMESTNSRDPVIERTPDMSVNTHAGNFTLKM